MSIPTKQVRRAVKLLFRWCVTDGRLDEQRARQVVQGILESKRRGYLVALEQFKRLVKIQLAKQTARVESAAHLAPDLLVRVREGLESAYGGELTTTFAENPNLIGGLRIQVGDDIYDGSVQSRLAALKASFGITTGRETAPRLRT
jgi:F-type H+-transporting ATPase subunit delta